jgi:hypothetical protein
MLTHSEGSHQLCSVGLVLEKCMRKLWAARKTYQTKYLDPQEKLWIAPKGKPVVPTIRRCHLFLVPTEILE